MQTRRQTRTHKPWLTGLGLATLVTLNLVAQPTANAQGGSLVLGNGDALTVNSTGTSGTYQGTPVTSPMSGYTSYDDGGIKNTSGHYATVEADGTSGFTLGNGGAITEDAKAAVYSYGLYAHGSGAVTVTGGSITASQYGAGLYADGSGTVSVSGGDIRAGGYSQGIMASGSGSIFISGGSFTGFYDGLEDTESSTITISGGSFYGDAAVAADSTASIITITGGAFHPGLFGSGFAGFSATKGTINLFSEGDTPFLIDGVAMNNMSIPTGTSGTISGILLDGEAFSTTFTNSFGTQYGTINLNVGTAPAPEPSQDAALSIGMLGLAGLTLRARRRAQAV